MPQTSEAASSDPSTSPQTAPSDGSTASPPAAEGASTQSAAPEAGTANESGGDLLDKVSEATPDVTNRFVEAIEAQIVQWFPFYDDNPLLQGVTILLIFLVLSSVASWFLKRIVAQWFSKTETDLDDRVLAALTGPVYVTMLAMGFRIAIARLDLADSVTSVVGSLLATLVILAWLRALIQITGALLQAISNTGHVGVLRHDTVPLFSNLSTIALIVLAVYLIIIAWDGNVSGLLALGGVGGLVIGLAAQDTISNLFAGIFIFADSPYKVGDYINLDSGERGKVTNIGIRSTRILTRDDVEITVPNSAIANAKIINESGGPHVKYRIRIKVGVAYGTDLGEVRRLLEEVAAEHDLAEEDPAPRVRMRGFGASSLDFELLCWIAEPELRGRATDTLLVAVYEKFGEHDIEIPYAKHDLYVKEFPGSSALASAAEAVADDEA